MTALPHVNQRSSQRARVLLDARQARLRLWNAIEARNVVAAFEVIPVILRVFDEMLSLITVEEGQREETIQL